MTPSTVNEENCLDNEMMELTVQLLTLSQNLINAKLKLENVSKNGWIMMAKTRYVSGGVSSVSMAQVPSDDIVPTIRLHSRECAQENQVRYHHFNIADEDCSEIVHEDKKEGLRLRKGDHSDDKVSEYDLMKPKARDPLKWFGVLSPPSLRQSQNCFKSAIELTIDCANIQSEILGVLNRIKYIKRKMNKTQSLDNLEKSIENLDSKFAEIVQV